MDMPSMQQAKRQPSLATIDQNSAIKNTLRRMKRSDTDSTVRTNNNASFDMPIKPGLKAGMAQVAGRFWGEVFCCPVRYILVFHCTFMLMN